MSKLQFCTFIFAGLLIKFVTAYQLHSYFTSRATYNNTSVNNNSLVMLNSTIKTVISDLVQQAVDDN